MKKLCLYKTTSSFSVNKHFQLFCKYTLIDNINFDLTIYFVHCALS